jgi:hypothetical protein
MFAMTSLVGTRVVATPKATRAVRSTTTVAAAGKKAPAKKKGEKKSFGEWLLEKSCRDSGAIGAGYEGELKDGRFKGKKK